MPRAVQEANIRRPGAGRQGVVISSFSQPRAELPSPELSPFENVSAPTRWASGAVVVAAGGLALLFVLNTMFWMLLKGAVALAVVVFLVRRLGERGFAQTGADLLRAVQSAPRHWVVGGALLLIAYALAGDAGFLLAAGVCIGVYVRARLIDWP